MTTDVKPTLYLDGTKLLVGGVATEIVNDTNIANWITSLSPAGATLYDTDWVDCTYLSGYTAGTPGQLQVRRIGKTVYIRGGATGPIAHAVYTAVATIPEGFRPPIILRTGGAGASGRHSLVEITAAGSVNIAWHNYGTSTAAPSWAAVATAYTVD